MNADLTYARQGRSTRAMLAVGAIWLGLAALWWGLDGHPLIIACLGLFTLPACWDIITNPSSGLTLTADTLQWHTGRREATVALSDIDHVRMNTRLDFSVKVTLVLRTGVKLVLPFEATPPGLELETKLARFGVKVQRTHFQLMQ